MVKNFKFMLIKVIINNFLHIKTFKDRKLYIYI